MTDLEYCKTRALVALKALDRECPELELGKNIQLVEERVSLDGLRTEIEFSINVIENNQVEVNEDLAEMIDNVVCWLQTTADVLYDTINIDFGTLEVESIKS